MNGRGKEGMKAKLFALSVMIIATVALSLSGCVLARKHVSIEVSCDEFYTNPHIENEVHIPVDGTVTLTLCSNPTTGFQ
jgi:hypothetical protein